MTDVNEIWEAVAMAAGMLVEGDGDAGRELLRATLHDETGPPLCPACVAVHLADAVTAALAHQRLPA